MALKKETIGHRKINNLCPKCGQPNATDRKMCEKHLAQESVRSNRNQKKRRAARKEDNICTVCGKQDAVAGKALCAICAANCTERMAELQHRRAKKGICIDCGQLPARDGLTTCGNCRQAATIRQRKRRTSFEDHGLCVMCGGDISVDGHKLCKPCCDSRNEWYAASAYRDRYTGIRAEHKAEVFEHYGNECSCCGEDEPCFLAIDHINGGGNKHRKEIGKAGSGFYKWLIDNQFPDGFQLLCHNCNMGKHLNNGICPHKSCIST